LIVWSLLMASAPAAQRGQANIVIEGLDPVRLVAGEEIPGKLELHADHGGHRYLFATAEAREVFLKDPGHYAVQMGGICARMGPTRLVYSPNPPVYGPPFRTGHWEIWTVHDGRIYLFSHPECLEAFRQTPARYLEKEIPPLQASAPELEKGRRLVDRAVAAAGGAALDGVASYTAQSVVKPNGPEAEVAVTVQWTRDGSARIVVEDGPITKSATTTPAGGELRAARGSSVLVAEPMLPAFREFYLRTLRYHHDIVGVLQARTQADFRAAATAAPEGAAPGLEHVAVRIGDDTAITIGIDATSGRIRTLTFPGRTSHGFVGVRTLTFDDFRETSGLMLPYKIDARFNGEPDPEWTWTVTSIRLNEPIDPALFQVR
jgi:YHS domain-containing protein